MNVLLDDHVDTSQIAHGRMLILFESILVTIYLKFIIVRLSCLLLLQNKT